MLYIGIVIAIIAVIWLKCGNNADKVTEKETGAMKKVTDIKIILFLLGLSVASISGMDGDRKGGTGGKRGQGGLRKIELCK